MSFKLISLPSQLFLIPHGTPSHYILPVTANHLENAIGLLDE